VLAWKKPAAQLSQTDARTAELNFPAAHAVHAANPEAATVPAAHGTHKLAVVAAEEAR